MKRPVILTLLGLMIAMTVAGGCLPIDVIRQQGDICAVVNCAALGWVDPGPRNPLVPSAPDYDKDPTCTLPGFCGPNIWYPYGIPPTDQQ